MAASSVCSKYVPEPTDSVHDMYRKTSRVLLMRSWAK